MSSWPCSTCEVVTERQLYAHYYHRCDGCEAMAKYMGEKGEDADEQV